jgi:hypothetical protein
MENLKLSIGFALLPFAFCIFVLDRIIYTIMPQLDHKNFNEWLTSSNVLFAVIRIVMLFVLRVLVYWVFKI